MSWARAGRGLLLSDAVNSAALNDQTTCIDADDLLSGETFAQDSQCAVVFLLLHEDRHDDSAVADKEVGIAGRQLFQPPSLSHERFRHGQRDDFHTAAVGSA